MFKTIIFYGMEFYSSNLVIAFLVWTPSSSDFCFSSEMSSSVQMLLSESLKKKTCRWYNDRFRRISLRVVW